MEGNSSLGLLPSLYFSERSDYWDDDFQENRHLSQLPVSLPDLGPCMRVQRYQLQLMILQIRSAKPAILENLCQADTVVLRDGALIFL